MDAVPQFLLKDQEMDPIRPSFRRLVIVYVPYLCTEIFSFFIWICCYLLSVQEAPTISKLELHRLQAHFSGCLTVKPDSCAIRKVCIFIFLLRRSSVSYTFINEVSPFVCS